MLDRNSVLTLMEECFWDEIETFTIECVSELGTDELETEETEIRYKYSFEMMNGKVISEIELEMS